MHFLQGDIVTIPFPFTDQSGNKLRPAVIVSNSTVNKTSDIILAAITSQLRNDEFSFFLNNGNVKKPLHNDCEVRCDKLFTANKQLVHKKISSLTNDALSHLCKKVASLLEQEK